MRQLIVFIVLDMMLCFRFSMRIMLKHTDVLIVAEQHLHRAKDVLVSAAALPKRSWGGQNHDG